MGYPLFQVNAFTDVPFAGNPAAVCILNESQPSEWMQQVAAEMNLSETAFLLPQEDGYHLRWFTPTTEVPLCGHATLASACVLWSQGYLAEDATARFYTQSGLLIAKKSGTWIELDFPGNFSQPVAVLPELSAALGVIVNSVWENSLGYLVEVESEEIVRQMQPDFSAIAAVKPGTCIVTSLANPNSGYDFVSRFFAPGLGINEDPVTGAAHCCLAPFWGERLGKNEFVAYQASSRGGVVRVRCDRNSNRVFLAGQAVTIWRGELLV